MLDVFADLPEHVAELDHSLELRLIAVCAVLWKIRERVERDIALPGLPRKKVMATIVWLLERTLIRVGSHELAKANNSFE